MVELTDEQWAKYEDRYGSLMHTISNMISGDSAIASHEDNYADLCVAALESIEGFKNKTGEDFDVAINNKLFDQYTKTVLWNRKAKKGIPLTKRMEFRNKHYSIDRDMTVYGGEGEEQGSHGRIEDVRSGYAASAMELEDFTESQPDHVKTVINAVLKDPKLLHKDGTFNKSGLMKTTGLSLWFTRKAIATIRTSTRRKYEA